MMTQYVPKRQCFKQAQMEARTALAVIDQNMSRGRHEAATKDGEMQCRLVFCKATAQ